MDLSKAFWRVGSMRHSKSYRVASIAALLVVAGCLGLTAVRADITGFNGGCNWQAQGTGGSVPYFSTCPDQLTLTDDMNNEAASAFYLDQQNINSFKAQFTYQMSGGLDANGNSNPADGMAFVIQERGPTALDGSGGCLAWCGISPSIAVALNIYGGRADGIIGTNVFFNGNLTFDCMGNPVYMDSTPVNLRSGDPIQVNLTYDGTTLTETLLDTITGDTNSFSYPIDLVTTLSGNTSAFVGFTAGTGGAHASQTVTGFSYTYTGTCP
jgi:hypothetical protein